MLLTKCGLFEYISVYCALLIFVAVLASLIFCFSRNKEGKTYRRVFVLITFWKTVHVMENCFSCVYNL